MITYGNTQVEEKTAVTAYEHRGNGVEDQGIPPEVWNVPNASGREPYTKEPWVLRVDCSGFIRNVFGTVTGGELAVSLSDRRFMRARDFYNFFGTVPSVTAEKDTSLIWRRVPGIKMILPGDIIAYAPVGNFTKFDSADVRTLLIHVRLRQLRLETEAGEVHLVVAAGEVLQHEPVFAAWVEPVMAKLARLGIKEVNDLRRHLEPDPEQINREMEELDERPFKHEL